MNKILFIIYLFLLCPILGIGQQKTTISKGLVVDVENRAVRAVSIRSLKTGNEIATDKDGRFTLQVALPDTLTISRIGYITQRVAVGQIESTIPIILQSAEQQIEEVLVHTGYQSLRPNEVNGSVTVINKDMLQMQNGTNILQRLNGVTNGLSFNVGKNNSNPQNKTNIMVRGHSTINGPLDPLIVLDNFVYEGDIDNINPDDIESVTILKDASATSIYGARGGNGVIVITSKRGRFNQPVQIDVRASTMITAIPDLSPLRTMDNKDYIAVERLLYDRGVFKADIQSLEYPALSPVVDILYRQEKGMLSTVEAESRIRGYEQSDFLKQYQQAFLKRGSTQQYALGIRGGSGTQHWNLGANLNQDNDTYSNRSKRINLRLSNSLKITPWLSSTVDAQVNARSANNGAVPTVDELRRVGSRSNVPYISLYDQQGLPAAVYTGFSSIFLDTAGGGRLQDWRYYPIAERDLQQFSQGVHELIGSFQLEARPIQGLGLNAYYQYQQQRLDAETVHDRNSFVMRDLINRFTQVNPQTGSLSYPVPLGDRLILQDRSLGSQQFRTQANFNKAWRKHHISSMLGFEVREVKSGSQQMWIYGYNHDPLSRVAVNHSTAYALQPAGIALIPGGSQTDADIVNRFVSLYGNAYYSYKDRYSLSGSLRRDGSNIYGLTTNAKWKPLWSIGLGWELSKESFFKVDFIDHLKLRSTLGYSGNVDLSRTALPIAAYSNGEAALGSLRTARVGSLNNPSLRWEQVRQLNIGLDFKMLQSRVSGTVEYYWKSSTDLYGSALFDYTTWGVNPTVMMNTADLAGRGIDMQLNIIPLRGRLHWGSYFIFNYNSNKTKRYQLTSTQQRSDIDRLIERDGSAINPIEGMPLYALGGYRWAGLDDKGNPQGYLNGEKSIAYQDIRADVRQHGDPNNARYIGSAVPFIFGAWRNEFSYANIGLSFNVTYRTGYYFRRQSIHYEALINRGYGHADYALRWQQPGDEWKTDVPAFESTITSGRDNFYALSDVLVEKGDHIRLQFVNLSYQFKSKSKYMPKSTRVFLNASDLGIIWRANKHELDPDYPYSTRPSQTYTIGINAQF
ncbi:TonB-linked outer membrane protein, SusC/RagA family [Sphingobacterium nematocida]|uniref:TonB-linked outer membrane protein, SusC/RagA family n=1 Tax=Sphingobacterium nematocida TaxID=1513896 RepID=A0A1T5EKX8_9SPHI|nr:SusC/RagA family TonB-linked outer membrane protein [Sphingobacterium nematocida]SKB84529.1 TonB-linked outer membrane protein, SusC/RagA family [Sphingobacterium nematocida]